MRDGKQSGGEMEGDGTPTRYNYVFDNEVNKQC